MTQETLDHIPKELAEMILTKLPVKSLKRFLTANKEWCKFITSNRFISEHLKFTSSPNQDKALFLVDFTSEGSLLCEETGLYDQHVYFDYDPNQWRYVLYSDDDDHHKPFDDYAIIRTPAEGFSKNMHVFGCCNGLICLSDYKQVILWNPAIRMFLQLPVSHEDFRTQLRHTFGFMFDNIDNDFKVLRTNNFEEVEVFRLSTNLWERWTKEVPFNEIYGYQVDLKGFSHWIGANHEEKMTIISFDVHKEVFGSIEISAALEEDLGLRFYLFSFEESLVLIHYVDEVVRLRGINSDRHSRRRFDLWKLEEYGNAESWNLWRSLRCNERRFPFGFRKNGQFLWVGERCRKFISTNL